MKKSISILSFFFLSTFGNAQVHEFGWAKRMGAGGVNQDYGYSIASDNAGNVYTTGSFSATTDFDPGPGTFTLTNAGSNDIFIQKLDKLGNFVWAKNIPGTFDESGIAIDIGTNGNVFISGQFTGPTDFDPGAGVTTLSNSGAYDIFVLCLDPSGNFVWAKSFGGSSSEYVTNMTLNSLNDVLITGYFSGTTDFDPSAGTNNITSNGGDDFFISKLDVSGNYQWTKRIGGAFDEYIYDISCNTSNQIVVSGKFTGTLDFDPNATTANMTATNMDDAFVLQLDNNGTYVWSAKLGGNGVETAYGITTDNANNVYVTGYLNASMDADPGAGVYNLATTGANDIFVEKLNSSGGFSWAFVLGATNNDNGRDIAVGANGNVYTCGYYRSSFDFDPGPGTTTATSNGLGDIFIHAVDNNGNFLWVKPVGGSGEDYIKSVHITNANSILATGWFVGTIDFNPGSEVYNLTSAGSNDAFVQKFCLPSSSNINVSACYTYSSPSNNYTWTVGGVYQDTILNVEGCDSIITINLTINGTTFNTINAEACDIYMSPSGNYTWSAAGTYTDTITNFNGCDSILTINLSMLQSDTNITISNGTYTVGQTGAIYQWFDCNLQAIIPGETNQSFTPTANGSYGVWISYNGCIDTTSCYTINNVGIENSSESNLLIYPNPASEIIQIQSTSTPGVVELIDIAGESLSILYNVNVVDISKLPSGIYLLRMQLDNKTVIKHFIKQ